MSKTRHCTYIQNDVIVINGLKNFTFIVSEKSKFYKISLSESYERNDHNMLFTET